MGGPAGWICSSGIVLAAVLMMPSIAISLSQSSVNLGAAGNYVILTKTGISATGVTIITGDIGVSPIKATGITGFGLIMDASGTFSTSSLVTGKIYASDYTVPTPTKMTTAISNLETAYTDAATRPTPDSLNLGAGNVTGKTLHAGLYKWGTDLLISGGGVTLSGSATDIWILQISGNLDLVGAVTLTDGAKASNIFWQVAGQVSLETGATMNGILLCQTAIVMKSGAKLNGRALALTAVTMDANTVVVPGIVNAIGNNSSVSRNFALEQNYPNPFNPSTTIQYSLENAAQVSLKVYNLLGQDVATLVNDRQEAGSYVVPFNALNLSSGVYFYRLEAGSFVSMKRLVYMK
jgi:hypothetical protein